MVNEGVFVQTVRCLLGSSSSSLSRDEVDSLRLTSFSLRKASCTTGSSGRSLGALFLSFWLVCSRSVSAVRRRSCSVTLVCCGLGLRRMSTEDLSEKSEEIESWYCPFVLSIWSGATASASKSQVSLGCFRVRRGGRNWQSAVGHP